MMRRAFILSVAVVVGSCFSLSAQEKKPAPYPPVDPNKAKLVQTLAGLDGPGFDIVASPDVDLIFASCDRGSIQGWSKDVILNIRTGTGSANRWASHTGPVVALAWNGGPVLASAGIDHKINFWSTKDGAVLGSATTKENVRALAMSADGATVASAGEDAAIQLWDTATAKPKSTLTDHKEWITALAFSPDGQLASGDYSGKVFLWDPAGKKVRDLTPIPNPKEPPTPFPVDALTFSPDSKTLVIGTTLGDIHMVGLDGKLLRTLKGHTSSVTGLAFHPLGQLLVSTSRDRTLKLWNPAAVAPLKSLDGHNAWVEGVAFTNRGTAIATVGADQTVRLWSLTD